MIPIWKMAWWTVPSCLLTPVLREPQKNGGQAEQALGRSRGGFSTKIHVTVDGLGYPLRLHLTAGQRHDIIKAHDLIVDLEFDFVIADRSYGAQDFVDELITSGIEPVLPPNKNAKEARAYDAWRYRERHLIECFIGKIKHFRRVFSRFDKLAKRYLGFLQFVSSLIWLR
jgi:transposase